jgi:hypothetical protein
MNTFDLGSIISTVGVVSMLGGFLYVGRKLQLLDDLVKTVNTMKYNLKVLSDHITRSDTTFDPSELKMYSPLHLTSSGNKLIKTVKFDEIFENNREVFYAVIDSEEPKLKYDVEASAIKSIFALSDESFMNPLKIYFYNNPNRNLQNAAPTFGVYIRDKYLADHPEIVE